MPPGARPAAAHPAGVLGAAASPYCRRLRARLRRRPLRGGDLPARGAPLGKGGDEVQKDVCFLYKCVEQNNHFWYRTAGYKLVTCFKVLRIASVLVAIVGMQMIDTFHILKFLTQV